MSLKIISLPLILHPSSKCTHYCLKNIEHELTENLSLHEILGNMRVASNVVFDDISIFHVCMGGWEEL